MRGIILAGGTGSRLGPLTKSVNKHLLNVAGLPMIFYPLMTLRNNGITDITIVSSPDGIGQLAKCLGSGKDHGCLFTYRVQSEPGGIADAMKCGWDQSQQSIAVILGDNVFHSRPVIGYSGIGACCYVKEINDEETLKSFGVPRFEYGRIVEVEEKPTHPKSWYAVTGLYVFSSGVWQSLATLKPGKRGELEISDLLDMYAKLGGLSYRIVEGFWGDAGTIEGMRECEEALRG